MKAGWSKARLESVCHEITDGSHFSPKTTLSGYPYITVRDIENDRVDFNNCKFIGEIDFKQLLKNGCKPNLGDVLFSKDGTVGKVSLVDYEKEFVVLSSLAIIRPKQEIVNSAFLKYMLQSPIFLDEAIGKKTGVAIRRIILRNLKSIFVPTPPIDEQQRIVAILDQAFEGITKARANAEQNLQNARALFESHLQSVFTQRGDHWQMRKLGDTSLLKIIDGDRGANYPNKDDFKNEGYCLFLNTKNVRPDGFSFESKMFITEQKDKLLRNGKLQRQDVILTTRGTIGNVAIYDESVEFENVRINSGMLIFRPKPELIRSSYLFEVFRSGIMKNQIVRHVSGAAQPQLPIKTLIEFKIPVPNSLEQQNEIVNSVRTIEKETQRLEALYQRKIACLNELKKSLLQQAFAGEL